MEADESELAQRSEGHSRSQLKRAWTAGTEHLIDPVRRLSETWTEQVAAAPGKIGDIEDIERLANQNDVKPFSDSAIPAHAKIVS